MARGARNARALERAAAHRLARALLVSLGGSAHRVDVSYAPSGAPRARAAGRPVPISWSHSGGFAAVATSAEAPVAIGIDVEPVDRIGTEPTRALALARRWLGPLAADALLSVRPERRCSAFLRLWAAREALLKAQEHAGGLFPLPLCASALSRLAAGGSAPAATPTGWSRAHLDGAPVVCAWTEPRGCVAALAASAPQPVQRAWLD